MSNIYDLIIIGAGPAGLTAAIYMARARYSVLLIEKERIGGQIAITEEVVNYPGIAITDGKKLTATMKAQAEAFGAEVLMTKVQSLNTEGVVKEVVTSQGTFQAVSVLLATGASPRKLGFVGEEQFQGRGVAYCATCDGEFFTGKDIFVIGGGFAAAEEAMFLTKYGESIHVIVRGSQFTCAKTIADEVINHEKIQVHFHTELKEVGGEFALQYARFVNNKTQEEWKYTAKEEDTFGVFVLAGRKPANELVNEELDLNENGYILTNHNQKTSVDGIYAAGDVCVKDLRQVVTAVSDGAIAATSMEKYISQIHAEKGIKTKVLKVQDKETDKEADKETDKEAGTNSKEQSRTATSVGVETSEFISLDMIPKLEAVFAKLEYEVFCKVYTNDTPISKEAQRFAQEISQISDKVNYEVVISEDDTKDLPSIEIWRGEEYSGLAFHGVPGGHEFNSFVIAIYNVGSTGQEVSEDTLNKIKAIDKTIDMKIIVSLSCTMCPDLVMAAQKIASVNPKVKAEVFDIAHFEKYKEKYKIMSVPCVVINDEKVVFGKKSVEELLEIL